MKELKGVDELPANWCVKRTPENAEILNAWQCQRLQEGYYTSDTGYIHDQGSSDEIPYDYCICEKTTTKHTEITFEQWQTIPEVAEWLKTYNMSTREAILKGVISTEKVEETIAFGHNVSRHGVTELQGDKTGLSNTTFIGHIDPLKNTTGSNVFIGGSPEFEKVEEREIIGYEAPRDLFGKRIKAGTVFTKCAITTVSFEYIHGQTILPAEWVETWKPVYAEKPVFKVGDYATFKGNDTFKISRITEHYLHAEGEWGYLKECCTVATPEEIEAAKPKKRKYMKQVWCIVGVSESEIKAHTFLYTNDGRPVKFDTEPAARKYLLEISVDNRVYKVEPFEVVAYE